MGVLFVNYHKNKQTLLKKQAGFTLIELTIVMIISSLLFVPLIKIYEIRQKKKIIETTRERLFLSDSLITDYGENSLHDGYPCPADPSLPESDANYGLSFIDCNAFADEAAFLVGLAAAGLGAAGTCTNGDGTGVCRAEGFVDHNGDGALDPILIGMVPIEQVVFEGDTEGDPSYESVYDAWGGRFTYAVSAFLTNDNTYNFYSGVIAVVDEFGNPAVNNTNDAHYTITSHGENNSGAYHAESGSIIQACGLLPPAVGSAAENENCNNDGVFMASIGYYKASTTQYYDDFMYYYTAYDTEIWADHDLFPNHMRNLNDRNVGVGTDTPVERVHVVGDVKAAGGVRASTVCDNATGECFSIDAIAGNAGVISCGNQEALTGLNASVTNPAPDCRNISIDTPANGGTTLQPRDCSPGWVRGITTDGQIICTGD
jgi:prepilin-type N-terminal cleavage/methylation domain-containing protein